MAYFEALCQHVLGGTIENRENSSQYRRSSDRPRSEVIFTENVKSKPTMSTVVKSAVSCGVPAISLSVSVYGASNIYFAFECRRKNIYKCPKS